MAKPSHQRSVVLRLMLLSSTTLLPLLIGKLAIPLDRYTFRCWETLADHRLPCLKRGAFYPSQRLAKIEVGGLGVHTGYRIPRHLEWDTDAWGWRNRPPSDDQPPDIVLVGDSYVAGAALDQDEMLSESLGRQLGRRVYSYAPAQVHTLLAEARFRAQPPLVIVLVLGEMTLYGQSEALQETGGAPPANTSLQSVAQRLSCRLLPEPWSLRLDRFQKKPFVNYYAMQAFRNSCCALLASRQFGVPWPQLATMSCPFVVDRTSQMLFGTFALREAARYQQDPEGCLQYAATLVQGARDEASGRGIRFLFVPVPDKTRIYRDRVPTEYANTFEQDFVARLVSRLRRAGVDVVDLLPAYEAARGRGALLYHLDDVHWNAAGVSLASELVAQRLAPLLDHRAPRRADRAERTPPTPGT